MPIEQARWNQSNIDSMFYAGSQKFVNGYFNFSPNVTSQQYYFNLVQQPVNMITGYQRQHRKAITFTPIQGADPTTTDQYTRLISHVSNSEGILEQYSKACELAAVSGMVLMQPYLDYTGEDGAQGTLKLKIWEYNAFLVDPYFRNPDMSDAQFVWCQEYISKKEAEQRFEDQLDKIQPMSGAPKRNGRFYFLPENHNASNNNLMVLSYVWYKSTRKKKRLYSKSKQQFFDFAGGEDQLDLILQGITDFEEVEVEVPCWKTAVILNDQLMFKGENPLGFDQCPFIPVFWNYDPQLPYYDLRVRSLVRTMRDPQFLFNYKVITNNDIAAATINAGWKRKIGAVANEDNLKKAGQGWDVIINEGYELQDCEKIIPSAVPQSDLELAKQMQELIFSTSGIDMENWSGQEDTQISSLTLMLKQAANLMVFQKYFDQWDYSLKLLGELMLMICLNNWNAEKIQLYIGEEPTPHFFSKVFAKYKTVVEEGLLTPTQKNLQAKQMMDINQAFGREVIPPSMIIKDMNIQGKNEIMEFLQQQEEQASQMQQQQAQMADAMEDAKLKELYTKAANNIAMAKERYGRFESNVGLLEERMAEVSKNHALSTKAKMEALEKMVDVISRYGEIETSLKMNEIESYSYKDAAQEESEKQSARQDAQSNEFLNKLMNGLEQPGQEQQEPGMDPMQAMMQQ